METAISDLIALLADNLQQPLDFSELFEYVELAVEENKCGIDWV